MKDMRTIVASLLLLSVLAAGCAKVQEPEFRRVSNFRMKNLGFQEATIGLNVSYFNPNNFGVSVKETEADVYLDTVYLGRFVQDSSIAVRQNAEFSIPLTGSIPIRKALDLNMKDLGSREILLRAEGSTKVGKAGIFVNKKIHYEGRHRLEDIKLFQ